MILFLRLAYLLLGLGLSMTSLPGYCNGALIDIAETDSRIDLGQHLEYIKPKRLPANASPSDVDASLGHWKPTPATSETLGLRAGTYWFRATLINRSDKLRELLLVNDFPSINQLSLYRIDTDGTVTTLITDGGLLFAHQPRANPYHKLATNLQLAPNETATLLWRVESTPLFRFHPILWDQTQFYQQDHSRTLLFGMLYGGLTLLAIYTIFLWGLSRDKTCIYFLIYLFATSYMIMANEGDLYQFLLPSIAWPKVPLYVIVYAISVSSFCLFTSTVLSLRNHFPGHNLSLQITAGTSGLLMLIGGFFSQENAFLSAIWLGILLYLLALIAGIRMRSRGIRQANVFVIASFILAISMLSTGIALSGIAPIMTGNTDIDTYSAIGSVLMLIFFALALVDKVNQAQN